MKDLFDSYDQEDSEEEYLNPDEREQVANTIFASTDSSNSMPSSSYSRYSSEVKVEPDSRLTQFLIISFEQLVTITKRDNKLDGAILLDLPLASGDVVGCWIPKKLCSNLDLEHNTICVWDKFMVDRIEELGGLSYEPKYAVE